MELKTFKVLDEMGNAIHLNPNTAAPYAPRSFNVEMPATAVKIFAAGICFLREAPERANGTNRRAGKWGLLTLSLARPSENYIIHIDGRKVAEEKSKACRVELPVNSFKPGENLIVIRLGNYWRLHFGQGYFPFLFVQLANFGEASGLPSHDGWPLLREAQERTLILPNTGMATAIDVGVALDIHPRNKQAVGRRLALQALASTYGKAVESNGPAYQNFERRGSQLVIRFDHASGLAASDGQLPKGFSVAGADRVFHIATATIEGDGVSLSSDKVAEPVAARYAFSPNPVATLINAAGLPAYPFRTDDWNEITKPH